MGNRLLRMNRQQDDEVSVELFNIYKGKAMIVNVGTRRGRRTLVKREEKESF